MANLDFDTERRSSAMSALTDAGLTDEMLKAVETDPVIAQAMVEAARMAIANRNPFAQTVEEQIEALRRANHEEYWLIPDEVIDRLAETAPAWPQGRDTYRSFRIRLRSGHEGVIRTFEAHMARIRRVHGDEKFWRWPYLLSGRHQHDGRGVERLRLLSGHESHTPCVEWCIVQLDANRERKGGIMAVRGPKSLADEGLVLAWLFPRRTMAIDSDQWPAWFLAGYELNTPERSSEDPWDSVPFVGRDFWAGKVSLHASWSGNGEPQYSAPVFEE